MNQTESQARIDHALATYRRFLGDLRQAIFTGVLAVPPATIACPDTCRFGHWLAQAFERHDVEGLALVARVSRAHCTVHRDAAEIARLVARADPEAAHAAFHAPAFTAAVEELLEGLATLRRRLRAAA